MKTKKEYENVKKRLATGMKSQPKNAKDRRSTRFMNLNPDVNNSTI